MQRRRQHAIWTAGALVVLLLAGVAAWIVHGITVDRRLQVVGQAAALGAPGSLTPAVAPQPPAEAAAASLAADESLVDPATLAAAAVTTTALAAGSGEGTVRADGKADGDEPVRRVRKAEKKQAPRRQAAARAARDRTFIRCPPLGKQGAVMCRWHICNGGAGKEAACRPYLERKP
ncbi:hypothetical protein [Pseudoduganella buxea]|uniref:Uncharacterized protein n=1 Tax=Pseudoduganella buxea TaxID=1949069 RepID=A0A6I3T3N5_9BURK|nr:hypothetical protein [Pseudoduganella buxea]MTV54167.1 hypothetical protein [Pseudoduganella buxea]